MPRTPKAPHPASTAAAHPAKKKQTKKPNASATVELSLPSLPSPLAWTEPGSVIQPDDTAMMQRIFDAAVKHASTGEPYPLIVVGDGRLLSYQEMLQRSPDLSTFVGTSFYWRVYVRALAHRYIRESGAIGIEEESWEWSLDAFVFAPESRHTLRRADGSQAISARAWLDGLLETGEQHTHVALLAGLEATAAEMREAKLRREKEAAEAEAEAAKQRPRPPELRHSIGFLGATTKRESHVATARREMLMAIESVAAAHTNGDGSERDEKMLRLLEKQRDELQSRPAFIYQPLGWAERLVLHALAAIAREAGKLESHPSALQVRPDSNDPHPRIRIPFPGYSTLASVARFEMNKHGRFPPDTIKVIRNALKTLTEEPRFIQEPVRVQVGTGRNARWVDDVRTTLTLWVEASTTAITRSDELALHPVVIASHLHSYVPAGDLAASYTAARRAIGKTKMLDEYAACDEYLLYLASVQLGKVRGRARREARDAGASNREIAERAQSAIDDMAAAGDLRLEVPLLDSTLREVLKMDRVVRDRGETIAKQRIEESLAFAKARGTLIEYTRTTNAKGEARWDLVLAYPAVQTGAEDPNQGLLFLPEGTHVADV